MAFARSVRGLARHPSLILQVPHGRNELGNLYFKQELRDAQKLWEKTRSLALQEQLAEFGRRQLDPLYPIFRTCKPELAVETGVSMGISSGYILRALEDNGLGHLYSIDLPNKSYNLDPKYKLAKEKVHTDVLPKGTVTGQRIPSELRHRWTLLPEDSRIALPRLLEELGSIDSFFHDSEHTYANMMFEYETVWPRLKDGGLLISDDVDWNDAFKDFCESRRTRPIFFAGRGMTLK